MSLLATTGPTDGVANRLNIVDFVRDEKFFTLYVRALQAIQDRDQSDYSSFFQLGGIHGLPFTLWAKQDPSPPPYKSGYCTHSQVLFPTWHRVYVSIYEQVLQEEAKAIAARFTVEQSAWADAAKKWRHPFWDTGHSLIPPAEILTLEEVQIVDYSGRKINVKNPILRYKFHPIDPSFKGEPNFEDWPTTVRNPDANKKENIPALINKFDLEAEATREKTYNMLKFNDNWELFSNHGEFDNAHANSLEAVHDDIHGFVGQGETNGHMTSALFAGFDPIFWLHHSNVDRYLSLWQAIHPGIWVTPGPEREGSMGFAPGTQIDKDSALEPFYQTPDKPWTSVPLTDTTLLGYSYPDFDEVKGGSEDLIRDYINRRVDELYGIKPSKGGQNQTLDLLSAFKGVTMDHKSHLKLFDWTIHASWKKFELKESFAIIFYFAKNGNTVNKDNYIGSINSFRGTTPESCANCKDNEDVTEEGFVHLGRFVARDLDTFDPEAVHRYLRDNKMSYKVILNNQSVPLKSLNIRVEGVPLHLPPGESFPKLDGNVPIAVFTDVLDLVTGVVKFGITAAGAAAGATIGVAGAAAEATIGVAGAATGAAAGVAKAGLGVLGSIF